MEFLSVSYPQTHYNATYTCFWSSTHVQEFVYFFTKGAHTWLGDVVDLSRLCHEWSPKRVCTMHMTFSLKVEGVANPIYLDLSRGINKPNIGWEENLQLSLPAT